MSEAEKRPIVSVIALCYNHERFLLECLDSIAAQTSQGFQLIVTDDASKDSSARLIADWLGRNRPDATFIAHRVNRGICATLNEALVQVTGDFICMIATDDVWEPQKIERQLAVMSTAPDDVAVLYSDAWQIDEVGALLPEKFIAGHRPELKEPPQGDIFEAMAFRNFIPAMSTMIRTRAVREAGGYDEELLYEDWDMWLRLALKWRFLFMPEALARYRVVGTSMARTALMTASPARGRTNAILAHKCLSSGRLTPDLERLWKKKLVDQSYSLLELGDASAARHLFRAYRWTGNGRWGALAALAAVGLRGERFDRFRRLLGRGMR